MTRPTPPETDPRHSNPCRGSEAPLPAPTSTSCCPPERTAPAPCCPPRAADDQPGYSLWPFVAKWLETPTGRVPVVRTTLDGQDRFGRWMMRWGFGRDRYSIAPGIYAVGSPGLDAPVLVSANYKMSFDLLRQALDGIDAWILVIDTRGINVWCAAGKGTFSTAEIVQRVNCSSLDKLVRHRILIVPQLGAPGVAAHLVRQGCGFTVTYGPVRAKDLKAFLDSGLQATTEMRRVSFSTMDRLVLTPVELRGMLKPSLWAIPILLVLGGVGPQVFSFSQALARGGAALLAYLAGLLIGAVCVPVALPWVPGRAFSIKGALAGGMASLAALPLYLGQTGPLNALALILAILATASYCAMNFTGSTTFTSPSGVEKEMKRAIPLQLAAVAVAGACWLAAAF